MATKAVELRLRRLQELGCIACRKLGQYASPDIHHLNLGGHAGQKRRGDQYTIPLCPPHHRGVMWREELHGPSLALHPRRFREVFGSDDELLAEVNELLGVRLCHLCEHEYDAACGRHGCPNCLGEGDNE